MRKLITNFIKKQLDHKIIIKKDSGIKELKKEYDKKVLSICKIQNIKMK
jgi:hypothetical protein